jgi:hypothetical protein
MGFAPRWLSGHSRHRAFAHLKRIARSKSLAEPRVTMIYADRYIPSEVVQRMISSYAATARHPDLRPFEISNLLTLNAAVRESCDRAGVYLLYRADRTLIYIGMSVRNVSGRLRKHLSPTVQKSDFWQPRTPAWAQTVLVPNAWEAPSLEEFLTSHANMHTL